MGAQEPASPDGGAQACRGDSLIPALKASGAFADVERQAAGTPNGEGRLWTISKKGTAPSTLLGTIHLSDPRVLTLPHAAEAAFDKADRLVIETTGVLDPVKTAGHLLARSDLTRLPGDETLGGLLDPTQRKLVEKALDERGMPFASVRKLAPILIATSIMLPPCEAARQTRAASPQGKNAKAPTILDLTLARRAAGRGMPVEGLETLDEQFEALYSMPLKDQADTLVSTVEHLDRVPDVFETMIELYLDGRIAMIMPAVAAAIPDGGMLVGQGEGAAAFEKTLLTDRNGRMVERLEPALDKGDSFVAVGALHLPGAQGLVALLRERGWTVTRAD